MLPRFIAAAAPVIVLAWLAVVAVALPLALSIDEVLEVGGGASLPEDAESLRAFRELEKLREELAAPPLAASKAILVVRGLADPLDPEDFWALREPYEGFRERYGAFSWLDVAELALAEAEARAVEAVEGGFQLFSAVDGLWEAYTSALERLSGLVESVEALEGLLVRLDLAYSTAARSLEELAGRSQELYAAGEPVEAICLEAVPGFAELYIDVVRVEGLLEYYTEAFEEGLSEADIAFVTLATNLPEAGLEPVAPEFVVVVYQAVLSIGGPEAFDNYTAALIAGQLAEAAGGGEASRLVAAAWAEVAVRAPPLKVFLAERGVQEGQAAIASIVRDSMLPAAREAAARAVAELIVEEAPLQARTLLRLYLDSLVRLGCTPEVRADALREAVRSYLEGQGYPGEVAALAAEAVASGDAGEIRRAAALAVAYGAIAEAGLEGLDPELLAEVLIRYDPEAEAAIAASSILAERAAVDLAVEAFGAPREVLEVVVEEGVEAAAAKLVAEEALARGAPRELVDAILSDPPSSREEALERAVSVLKERLVGAGLREEPAGLLAEAVLRSYLEGDRDAALSAATEVLGSEAVDAVMSELEGVLVEPGRRGFIVALVEVRDYGEVEEAKGELAAMVAAIGGSEVLATGPLVFEAEMETTVVEDLRRSDMVSSVLVLAILAGVLGTVVGVFLPFVGIGAGLIVASAIVYLLASRDVVDVMDMSRALMISTGLGLGIDYAAYVSRRFRESLRGSRGPWEAAEEAVRRSWRPVAAGAFAAAAGFGSLTLAEGFPFARSIGMVVPISVLSVMVASLTLTPAILAIIGASRRLWWPSCPYRAYEAGSGAAAALTRLSTAVAPLTLVVVAVAAAAALFYLSGFEGSFDVRLFLPEGSESFEGLSVILDRYESGALFPLFVVASSEDEAEVLAPELEALECVLRAEASGRVVTVVLAVNPLGDEGVDCAEEVRERAHEVDPGSLVGGPAAENLDLRDALYREFYGKVLPAAAAMIFLIILVFYASLPAALTAVATIAVSTVVAVAAASVLAEAVGVGVPWFLPIVVTAALLGVGMDYNSFYLNSAREAALSTGFSRGYYMIAAKRGAALVVGLSMIMAGAYAGLSVSSIDAIRAASLGLTLGVLLAGVNSALLLTPSLAKLLGAWFWWPLYGVLVKPAGKGEGKSGEAGRGGG